MRFTIWPDKQFGEKYLSSPAKPITFYSATNPHVVHVELGVTSLGLMMTRDQVAVIHHELTQYLRDTMSDSVAAKMSA